MGTSDLLLQPLSVAAGELDYHPFIMSGVDDYAF